MLKEHLKHCTAQAICCHFSKARIQTCSAFSEWFIRKLPPSETNLFACYSHLTQDFLTCSRRHSLLWERREMGRERAMHFADRSGLEGAQWDLFKASFSILREYYLYIWHLITKPFFFILSTKQFTLKPNLLLLLMFLHVHFFYQVKGSVCLVQV